MKKMETSEQILKTKREIVEKKKCGKPKMPNREIAIKQRSKQVQKRKGKKKISKMENGK